MMEQFKFSGCSQETDCQGVIGLSPSSTDYEQSTYAVFSIQENSI